MNLTKTPYLVMFAILGGIGVTAVSAAVLVTVDNLTITGDMTCNNCVDSGDLGFGAVNVLNINNDAVRAFHILDGQVGSAEIDTDAVGSDEIATDAVDSDEIASNAIGLSEMGPNSVGPNQIGNNAVGASEIAANAVGLSEMKDDAIGNAEMRDNAIGSAEIAANAVGGSEVAGTTKLIFGKCMAVNVQLAPGATVNKSCVLGGLSTNEEIVATLNHPADLCYDVTQVRIVPGGTTSILFTIRNVCQSGVAPAIADIPIAYIIFQE